MKQAILAKLDAECPTRDTLHWFDSIESTNTYAKQMAAQGAPQGTVVIAGHQTGGRGRLGRSFSSPAGMGIYLSFILRPRCRPQEMMHLTCAAAVAACDAVQAAVGLHPQIKWTNDLVIGCKKLGGILTELSVDGKTGLVDFAVIGIGINCSQNEADFPEDIRHMAVSLSAACEKPISRSTVAATLIDELNKMAAHFLADRKEIIDRYRNLCITIGKKILVLRGGQSRYGKALDVDSEGGLIVEYPDGSQETVTSGEVSVRGMYGYI